MALCFLPNPDNHTQVNHKDGDKCNNIIDNLEWCSNSENQKHAVDTGLKVIQFSEKAVAANRWVLVYNRAGTLIHRVCGNQALAELGLDYRLVSACILGKRKRHRGFTYKAEYF